MVIVSKNRFYCVFFTRFIALSLLFWCEGNVSAQSIEDDAQSITRLESENLYRDVPDVLITLSSGEKISLSTLWKEQPLLINMFYMNCTGSCSPFLRSLKAAAKRTGGLGTKYRILSITFDPDDTGERLVAYTKRLGVIDNDAWDFATATPEAVAQITSTIGFWYKLQPTTGQYDHPTLLAAVRDGKIQRVLFGNTVSQPRFTELVSELNGTFIPFYTLPGKSTPFRCLQFDPDSHTIWPHWGMLILVLPGALALGWAALIFRRR